MRDVDRPFRDEIRVVGSCEISGIVAHDVVHVLPYFCPSDEDRKLLMRPRVAPRSYDATHTFRLFHPFDEDRKLLIHPHVAR